MILNISDSRNIQHKKYCGICDTSSALSAFPNLPSLLSSSSEPKRDYLYRLSAVTTERLVGCPLLLSKRKWWKSVKCKRNWVVARGCGRANRGQEVPLHQALEIHPQGASRGRQGQHSYKDGKEEEMSVLAQSLTLLTPWSKSILCHAIMFFFFFFT